LETVSPIHARSQPGRNSFFLSRAGVWNGRANPFDVGARDKMDLFGVTPGDFGAQNTHSRAEFF
jgi:hypothetical protein